MTDQQPTIPPKAGHPRCNHPAGILKFSNQLPERVVERYAETVRSRGVDGLVLVIAGDSDAEWQVIECSWCENPEAVARRHAAFSVPSRRWWQVIR